MSPIRGALTDENGQWDVAYISLFGLMLVVVSPIVIMTIMSMVAHFRCSPHELVADGKVTVVACNYDPQPLGIAIGSACGGFGVALGALAAYMAATRRPQQQASTTTTRVQETTTATAPPIVPTAEPLKVDVLNLPDPKPGREPKAVKVKRRGR